MDITGHLPELKRKFNLNEKMFLKNARNKFFKIGFFFFYLFLHETKF
jgi:hypothetical protein